MGVGTTSPECALSIRMFGPLEVTVGGEPIPKLRSRKSQWLLALLALRYDQTVDRRWLAGSLWPDAPEAQAYASLRQSLADLRRALGIEAGRLETQAATTLRFVLNDVELDVRDFDALCVREDIASLEHAVSLYRGPLLEGCTEDWILAEREPRHQIYLKTLEALAERQHEFDPERAQETLRRVVQVDPLRENAQRALMRSLADTGHFSEATHAYRELRLYLREQLNAEPDPSTTALYQQLRQQALDRLKSPSPPASRRNPGFVPLPLGPLIGRERETEEILSDLNRARLVTLTGPGGIGKTRLALEIARTVASSLSDGAWFVDLAPIQDPALVAQAVATALELHEVGSKPIQRLLTDHLRNRTLLIVLDNCEHVVDASAELALSLLETCPELKLLATSREALDIPGERVWLVPPLEQPPDDQAMPIGKQAATAFLEFAAVRLLVERIVAQCPSFTLTRENTPAILRICDRLDGIPLALELAAARAKALPIDQIADRLDDCFRLLTGGRRTAMPRHQTLGALIDWSYDLLSTPQQTLLRRLSTFAGGWTLEAAEIVCSTDEIEAFAPSDRAARADMRGLQDPLPELAATHSPRTFSNGSSMPDVLHALDVLDLLTQLVDKSLVVVEEGGRRFRLLETIRQYASARRQEANEGEWLAVRHQRYFHDLVAREPPKINEERTEWLSRLSDDHENFRACLERAITDPQGALIALRTATGLWRYCHERHAASDGLRWLDRALQNPAIGSAVLRAQAHNGAGVLAWDIGNAAQARRHLELSLSLYRALGDAPGTAHALNNLGLVAWMQGDMAEATALHRECLALRQQLNDPLMVAYSLYNLGLIACDDLQLDASRRYFDECLALFRQCDSAQGVGRTMDRLGYVAYLSGDPTAAVNLCRQSVAYFRTQNDLVSVAISLGTLSNISIDAGDWTTAREMLTEGLIVRRNAGNPSGTVDSLNGFGALAAAEELFQKAARLWGAADALAERIGCPLSRAEGHVRDQRLQRVRTGLGDPAFEAAREAGRQLTAEQAYAYALED